MNIDDQSNYMRLLKLVKQLRQAQREYMQVRATYGEDSNIRQEAGLKVAKASEEIDSFLIEIE